ncbi:MAG: hypothetical protein ACOVO9_03640 [Bacteroidia bacterium]
MKIKFSLLFILSFLFIPSIYAQEEVKSLNIKFNNSSPIVVPIGSNGFILISYSYEKKTKSKKINLEKYNTNFKLEKSLEFKIKNTERIVYQKYLEGKYLYLISSQGNLNDHTRRDLEELVIRSFSLIRIDIANLETNSIDIIQNTPFQVRNLIETTTNAYLIGDEGQSNKEVSSKKGFSCASCGFPIIASNNYFKPKIVKFDFNKKPGLKKNFEFSKYDNTKTKVLNSELIDSTDNLELLLHSNKNDKQKVLFQQVISEKCENATELGFPKGRTALSGKVILSDNKQKLISGIVIEEKHTNSLERDMPPSSGIYFAIIDDNKLKFNSIIDYPKFKNFKLLSKEDLYSVEKILKENKILSTNVSVKIYEIVERDDKYLIMGEAFTKSFVETNPSNVSYTYEGIKWLGGFILAFDKNGKFLWENALNPSEKILGIRSAKRVHFIEKESGDIEISGALKSKIQSKIIHLDGSSETDTYTEIVNQNKKSIFKNKKEDETFLEVLSWYDNYNLGHYYKEIKNKDSSDGLEKGNYIILKKLEITVD